MCKDLAHKGQKKFIQITNSIILLYGLIHLIWGIYLVIKYGSTFANVILLIGVIIFMVSLFGIWSVSQKTGTNCKVIAILIYSIILGVSIPVELIGAVLLFIYEDDLTNRIIDHTPLETSKRNIVGIQLSLVVIVIIHCVVLYCVWSYRKSVQRKGYTRHEDMELTYMNEEEKECPYGNRCLLLEANDRSHIVKYRHTPKANGSSKDSFSSQDKLGTALQTAERERLNSKHETKKSIDDDDDEYGW